MSHISCCDLWLLLKFSKYRLSFEESCDCFSCTREIDTNRMVQSVAHLLFHRPSELSSLKSHTMDSSVIAPRDGLSLMSHTTVSSVESGSIELHLMSELGLQCFDAYSRGTSQSNVKPVI